ncbi:MAG TPA: sigma 54-interacting transcriptional regulator [Ktedonobacteraceae bacterium]
MNRNKSTSSSKVDKVVDEIHRFLKHKHPILVALDGRSGTGKSTIAQVIASRLIMREGPDFMQRWHALWDVAEDYYFTSVRPRSSFDLIVKNQ